VAGRSPLVALGALFTLCVAVFLITIPVPRADNMLIGSDGVRYYLYARSLVVDGDLDFTNEYRDFVRPKHPPLLTPTGRPENNLPIGAGVVWIPFFVVAHAASWLLGLPATGYTYVYQAAVCLGSMLVAFVGLLATYRLCREWCAPFSAGLAVALMWFGGNLAYYMVVEPSMAHAASFAAVACLLAWWRLRRQRAGAVYWGVLGLLGGAAALIRPQDGLFLALPAVDWVLETCGHVRARRWPMLRKHCVYGGLTVLGAALVYSIQLSAWLSIYGSVVRGGYFYTPKNRFFWWRPRIPSVLFSLQHGLFTWHPIYLLAGMGLPLVARRDGRYAALLALGVLLQVYLVASWHVWWQGDAFGGRMFISTVAALTPPLALALDRLRRTHPRLLGALAAALLIWNFLFVVQYRLGLIPRGLPITMRQLLWDKFTLPITLWRHGGSQRPPGVRARPPSPEEAQQLGEPRLEQRSALAPQVLHLARQPLPFGQRLAYPGPNGRCVVAHMNGPAPEGLPQERPVRRDQWLAHRHRLVGAPLHGVIERREYDHDVGGLQETGVRVVGEKTGEREVRRAAVQPAHLCIAPVAGHEEAGPRYLARRSQHRIDRLVGGERVDDDDARRVTRRGQATRPEADRHVADDDGARTPVGDHAVQVRAGDDHRIGTHEDPSGQRQQPFPQRGARRCEAAAVRVDDDPCAVSPGIRPYRDGRADWRRRHQDQVRPLAAQNAPGHERVHGVAQRHLQRALVAQVVDHVRGAAEPLG
jgi:hypothetical protein